MLKKITAIAVSAAIIPGLLPIRANAVEKQTITLGLKGSFYCQAQEAVDLINSYRKEACDEGIKNPSTGKPLTAADYVPIKWDKDLEYIARIRAAESQLTIDHTRTDGSSSFTAKAPSGKNTWCETLAWNYSSKEMKYGIEQWYEEKSDYVNNTGKVTGHYTSLIDPTNVAVGIGFFTSEIGYFPSTTCGEYSSTEPSDSSNYGDEENTIAKLEFNLDTLSFDISGKTKIAPGGNSNLAVFASYTNPYGNYANGVTYSGLSVEDNISWRSSNESVATVQNGKVSGISEGNAVISAYYGENKLAEKEISVQEKSLKHINNVDICEAQADPNSDGNIDAKDATAILVDYANRIATSSNTLTLEEADANLDENIDAKDATLILVYYANSISNS